MPCIRIPNGIVCISDRKLYRYQGWFFSIEEKWGPWPLRKDRELRRRAGDKFWRMYAYFEREENQEQYQVG